MRVLGALLSLVLLSIRATPQRTDLDRVLARASNYVVEYGQALASVLAEESYSQRLVWRSSREPFETRLLKSEIAFVRVPDTTDWLSFRNVLAVDDVPILDAPGRLERIFQESPDAHVSRSRLASESARFNLGPVTREINVPTMSLHFVHPTFLASTRFDKIREEEFAGEQTWVIRFRERDRGSLISRIDGRKLPAQGLLWIVPADGRIVRSHLEVEGFVRERGGSKATIDVQWRRDAALDLWVPAELTELYEGPWRMGTKLGALERYDIDGIATYSNYRRFTVDVRIRVP